MHIAQQSIYFPIFCIFAIQARPMPSRGVRLSIRLSLPWNKTKRNVTGGLGRHFMPPPSANDTLQHWTKTAIWWHNLSTLNFDLEGHSACVWCGQSSTRPASVYQVWACSLTLTKDGQQRRI